MAVAARALSAGCSASSEGGANPLSLLNERLWPWVPVFSPRSPVPIPTLGFRKESGAMPAHYPTGGWQWRGDGVCQVGRQDDEE